MRPSSRRIHTIRLLLLGSLCFAVALPARAERTIDQTHAASPDGLVEIENIAGSVEVTGWDRAEVSVKGTVGDDVEKVEIDGSGSRTHIAVRLREEGGHHGSHDDGSAELHIRVPVASRLDVETVSADIHVDGVGGRLGLRAVSGDVGIAGSPQEVEAKTVSGSVSYTAASPRVDARSVSGKVTIGGKAQELEARTVSGPLQVAAGGVERVTLDSVSGTVGFRGDLAASGELSAKSHSGNVEVALPADFSGDFEMETFSGSIDSAFGPSPRSSRAHGPGQELSFTTGSGGGRVRLQSFSGSIEVTKK